MGAELGTQNVNYWHIKSPLADTAMSAPTVTDCQLLAGQSPSLVSRMAPSLTPPCCHQNGSTLVPGAETLHPFKSSVGEKCAAWIWTDWKKSAQGSASFSVVPLSPVLPGPAKKQ